MFGLPCLKEKSAQFFGVLNACMRFWYILYLHDLCHSCFLLYPVKFSGEREPQIERVWWSHCPWRYSKNNWMFPTQLDDKLVMAQRLHLMTLDVFSILNDSVIMFFLYSLHLFLCAVLISSDHKNTLVPFSIGML